MCNIHFLMTKKNLLNQIAETIGFIQKNSPILVCIDGVDGAGKSYFAKDLADEFGGSDKEVILASVDHFHNPRDVRYKKGNNSAEGFYHDSYNYDRFIEYLLEPFAAGNGFYKKSAFDVDLDAEIHSQPHPVTTNSILIVEGIFLQRPELIEFWDLKIFLDVDFEISLQRNINRVVDKKRIGSADAIANRYAERYMPGQLLYFAEADPKSNADIIIDNSDFQNPLLIRK